MAESSSSSGSALAGWTGLTGGAIQQRAQIEEDKLVKAARVHQMLTNMEFAKRSGALVQKGAKQQGSEATKQTLQEGRKTREKAFEQVQKTDLFGGGQANQTPQINPQDLLRTQGIGKNRAVLGSYGDWAMRDLISKIQIQNEMNKLNQEIGGFNDITAPAIEQKMARAYDDWKIAGAAIGMGGQVIGSELARQQDRNSANRAPTYVRTDGPYTSGSNSHYLQFSNNE